MKLYSLRDGATSVSDDDGTYKVDKDGAVEVPHEFGERLRDTHIAGAKAWEDETERHARLAAEEDARRRDPASAYDALTAIAAAVTAAPRKRAAKKAPAKPAPAPRKTTAKKAAPAPAKRPAKKA